MEASALTHPAQPSALVGRSPLLRLQGDEKLIAMTRRGHHGAFETLVGRYESRLLSFCRHMLGSTEDAEDVLQEVFTAAFNAMCADERPINARPWLYRIARNRCLNHLRRPQHSGQDSMDIFERDGGTSTADTVHKREEFRQVVADVQDLPETQRTALLLREMDALSYDQISEAMDTTVPSVKSLLVRARVSLAEAAEARLLTCDEVRLELGEVSEGLTKSSAPARRHLKGCDRCRSFKSELRRTNRALVAIYPLGPFIILKNFLGAKFGAGAFTGSATGGSATGGAAVGGGSAVSGGAVVGGGATVAGGAAGLAPVAAGGAAISGAGGAVGGGALAAASGGAGVSGFVSAGVGALASKAAAGVVAAAIVTAGAVEVGGSAALEEATKPTPAVTAPADPGARNEATSIGAPLRPGPVLPATEEPAVEAATTASSPAATKAGDEKAEAASAATTPEKPATSAAGDKASAVEKLSTASSPATGVVTSPRGGEQKAGSTVVLHHRGPSEVPLTAPVEPMSTFVAPAPQNGTSGSPGADGATGGAVPPADGDGSNSTSP